VASGCPFFFAIERVAFFIGRLPRKYGRAMPTWAASINTQIKIGDAKKMLFYF
jgi:hypothetical protein